MSNLKIKMVRGLPICTLLDPEGADGDECPECMGCADGQLFEIAPDSNGNPKHIGRVDVCLRAVIEKFGENK